MLRKCFTTLLFLLSIGTLYWSTPVSAHDAFYPHHREDFESMTRRRQLRGTVLLSTAAFFGILAAVVYFGLRKSKTVDNAQEEMDQVRLERITKESAKAAQYVLKAKGSVPEAMAATLTTYARASGVEWKTRSHVSGNAIRCKIGADVVTLSIHTESDAEVIRLKAEYQDSSAAVVLRVARENKE